MNLFLIENDKSVISNLLQPNDVVICFNYLPYLSVRESGQCNNVLFIEEILTKEDYFSLQRATDQFTSLWYQNEGIDVSLYDRISYGEISRSLINRKYLSAILVKYGEVIRLTVLKFNPGQIFCDFEDSENFYINYDDRGKFFSKVDLANTVCNQLGLSLTFINCDINIPSCFIAPSQSVNIGKSSVNLPLKLFIINGLEFFLVNIVNQINKLRFYRQSRILVQTSPNLLSLLRIKGTHLFIPNISSRNFFNRLHTSFIRLRSSRMQLSEEDLAFLLVLEDYALKSLKHTYVYNGIDYTIFYKRVAKQLIRIDIPNILSSRNIQIRSLLKNKIKIILDIDSEGARAQLRSELCHQLSIYYAFVDHGIQGFRPSSTLAQLPDYNIRFLAGTYDPYERQGNKIVTGSPCIDSYHSNRRRGIKGIHRVLFLGHEDNYYGRMDRIAYREKYLAEIIPLFPQLTKRGIEVFFRPHNENPYYYKYLFEYFNVDSDCYKLSNFFSNTFNEIIETMDLLVCNVSSCFFEAQAAGIPTIFFEPELIHNSLCLPYSGQNWDEVIRVSKGEELLDIIVRNVDDASELTSFLDNFLVKYSSMYIGPMDGKSGERIINFLTTHTD